MRTTRPEPLPDRLVIELTAERTLALRDKLATTAAVAFQAVLHKFCLDVFSRYFPTGRRWRCRCAAPASRCRPRAEGHARSQGDRCAPQGLEERLPKDKADLWTGSPPHRRGAGNALRPLRLLRRQCALREGRPLRRGRLVPHVEQRIAEADRLAQAVDLDMCRPAWRPTVENYLGGCRSAASLRRCRKAPASGRLNSSTT